MQPRNGEEVITVPLAAVVSLGRRRIQHVDADPEVLGGACRNRLRLRNDARGVLLQKMPVDDVQEGTARAFLEAIPCRQRAGELRPAVVLLAHRVVPPTHVSAMTPRVAGVSEAD